MACRLCCSPPPPRCLYWWPQSSAPPSHPDRGQPAGVHGCRGMRVWVLSLGFPCLRFGGFRVGDAEQNMSASRWSPVLPALPRNVCSRRRVLGMSGYDADHVDAFQHCGCVSQDAHSRHMTAAVTEVVKFYLFVYLAAPGRQPPPPWSQPHSG